MRVHFIGISGSGMGQLALLFEAAGHEVRGSDMAFDPPTGPLLRSAGITLLEGYRSEHLAGDLAKPDLVVVGNAIRKDNVEAVATRELGLPAISMSRALREHFLVGRRPFVVTGTHGKTTTSSLSAYILHEAGLEPGYFIGGIPKNFGQGSALGRVGKKKVSLAITGAAKVAPPVPEDAAGRAPFVVEGDEYDAVYWHKEPKFLDYVGVAQDEVVLLTSVEHDHIDIYPTADAYEASFRKMIAGLSESALLVVDARDVRARELTKEHARCQVAFYALDGDDTGDVTPTWLASPAPHDPNGLLPFDAFVGGSSAGRFYLSIPGAHNVRNALGAMAAAAQGFGVPLTIVRQALGKFEGVRRRQDLLGSPGGVAVYDDFAHHPTAVDETLRALRAKHRLGRLFAVFEPRSATACRNLHQDAYTTAFGAADRVLLAPLGRTNIAEDERLDTEKLAREIGASAIAVTKLDDIVATLRREAKRGDVVALLSNGAFGGLHAKVLAALGSDRASP